MKLAGVVVWYHPNINDVQNIFSYINDLDRLYIFDNSDNKNNRKFVPDSKKIKYISKKKNLGIATALNYAAKEAIREGYEFLLTMD